MDALHLPFSFFDAVDGSVLSAEQAAASYDPAKNAANFKRPIARPEIGCYLSHYALWESIGQAGWPGAVILEDDFEASPSLPAVLSELCRLQLSNCLIKLDTYKKVKGALIANLCDGIQLIFPYRAPGLTLGYVIDRQAAANLAAKTQPFGRPVDIDLKHWWEFNISVLAVQPALLHPRQTQDENGIELTRRRTKPGGRFIRFARNLEYQFAFWFRNVAAQRERRQMVRQLKSEVLMKLQPGH